ncbi:peptidylprolyl isomerase [Akkermansiaceae bacterium]|nr:peptidylprolyl isomerase [Akkermansiaceae bacterium]
MRLILSLLTIPTAVLAQNPVLPVLNQLFPDLEKDPGEAEERFSLADHFGAEEIRDNAVRFTAGWTLLDGTEETAEIDFLLFRDRTPITVTNFLGYVNRGDYTNMIVHRLVPGFVIQGGGFTMANDVNGDVAGAFIPTQPTIQNEFGVSNTLGTISMAKLGGDPDSATSQWFISTGANSDNLDFQNGGFTVFGKVSRDSFEAALELDRQEKFVRFDLSDVFNSSALSSTPLIRNTTGATFVSERFYRFSAASEIPLPAGQAGTDPNLTYLILSGAEGSGPIVEIIDGELVVGFPESIKGGIRTVVIQAEDSVGNTVTDTFEVSMEVDYESWRHTVFPEAVAADDSITGPTADFNNDGVSNLVSFVHGLDGNANASAGLNGPTLSFGASDVSIEIETGYIEGVGFEVEFSTDGENWDTEESTRSTTSNVDGKVERFTVARTVGDHPKSFYRLRYTID